MFTIKKILSRLSITKSLYLILIIVLLSLGNLVTYFLAILTFIGFTSYLIIFNFYKIKHKSYSSGILDFILDILIIVLNLIILSVSLFFVISNLSYNFYPTITLVVASILSLIGVIFSIVLLVNRKKYTGSAAFFVYLKENKCTLALYIFSIIMLLFLCCFDVVLYRIDLDKNYLYNYCLIGMLCLGFIIFCICCINKKSSINYIDINSLMVFGLIYCVLICFVFSNYFHYSGKDNPFPESSLKLLYLLIFLNSFCSLSFIPINLSINIKPKTIKIVYYKSSNSRSGSENFKNSRYKI